MRTEARFPRIGPGAGHYESFYIKATRPGGGRAVWIRHTVHKRPGAELTGSIWVTIFDADAEGPRATKVTVPAERVSAPGDAYIEVAGARLGPGTASGEAKTPELEVSWDLSFTDGAPPFRHLPYDLLYRAPLPKTKLLSPYPDSRFSGTVTVDGETTELAAWPGMIGHNWGAEHAERWSWIQANEFREGEGFFDAGVGKIKVGPMTTPWIGNAVLEIDGERHRLGGLDRVRSTKVEDRPTSCEFELAGKEISVRGRVSSEPRNFVAWVYADPVGPEHNTVNCSICDLELTVEAKGREVRRLECVGAAAYELGVHETDHGLALQPYPDG
ncbi:MAG: hypothetical protein QOI10_1848 [Solirubrobacterales bacterium]|jgi:hypothetical protein|nr:hypothetical protein [Solirubrobacterales bacterium]